MDYLALFMILSLLEILSATLIFVFKDILHAVLAFSLVFVFNSALFFVLAQPFLALLQLFIMVGGVSTYIFVGVGSASYSKFRHTNYTFLIVTYLAVFISFSYRITSVTPIIPETNLLSTTLISQSISSNLGLLYIIVLTLFGIGLSSIVLMKKLGEKR